VGDTEINFLTSFHLRFRRAVQELKGNPPESPTPYVVSVPAPERQAKAPENARKTADETKSPDVASTTRIGDEVTKVADRPPEKARPPQRLAPSKAKVDEAQEKNETVNVDVDDAVEPKSNAEDGSDNGGPAIRETPSTIVQRAMKDNDHQAVLREVYREVTGIAEVIWTTSEIPTTAVWDRVSTNRWYEASFSKLDLRPLSDFYGLISQVKAKRKSGLSKSDIQRFLNDSNFATTLLALRDMFQKNQI